MGVDVVFVVFGLVVFMLVFSVFGFCIRVCILGFAFVGYLWFGYWLCLCC